MEPLLKLRFLVVEDSSTMRKMMCLHLRSLGINDVTEAKDGKVACGLLQQEVAKGTPFHFVISDWNMHEMTGIELLIYCRSNELLKNVAFILVTAEADAAQTEKAKKAGVDSYVLKPIQSEPFQKVLMSVYKSRFQK